MKNSGIKKTLVILLTLLLSIPSFSQDPEAAKTLIREGIELHDRGEYVQAIEKYDKALEADEDNLLALAEKAMSLLSSGKYTKAIEVCQTAIAVHPGDEDLANVYVSYGTSLDMMKKPDEAVEVYNQGIKKFPSYYQLHFNKGITLMGLQKLEEAQTSFQNALYLNPRHPGSNNALARLNFINNKRIPAILAYSRFFVLEPQGQRAGQNLLAITELMNQGIESKGKKEVTITLNSDMMLDSTALADGVPNNFMIADITLSLTSALDYDKKFKKETEVDRFIRKFETLCSSLEEGKDENFGFFWEYYAPYFIDMKNNGMIRTFAYILHASSDDKKVKKWLDANDAEIKKFYSWSNSTEWPKN